MVGKVKRLGILLLALSAIALFGGCEEIPITEITCRKDAFVMEHYTKAADAYTDTEYERVLQTIKVRGMNMSMGPHEPEYRGMILLTDEKAKEIRDKYDWNKAETVEITFEKMEYKIPEDTEWYVAGGFAHDYFTLVSVKQVYFDGKNTIIYDIQTT